jgi:oxalate decarboxylase
MRGLCDKKPRLLARLTVSFSRETCHVRSASSRLADRDRGFGGRYGHSLDNVGDKKCRVLIGFNSGVGEDIDLSEWLAGNPSDVLATNFGKLEALFQRFPNRDVFIASGNAR